MSRTQAIKQDVTVRLRVKAGPSLGKEFKKQLKKITIGRTKASSFQIKDHSVSEKHAEIWYDQDQWLVKDLGSSNGTTLNGDQVTDKGRRLRDGDMLRIGTDTVVAVELHHLAKPEKQQEVQEGRSVPSGTSPQLEASSARPQAKAQRLSLKRKTYHEDKGPSNMEPDVSEACLTLDQYLVSRLQEAVQELRDCAAQSVAELRREWQQKRQDIHALVPGA